MQKIILVYIADMAKYDVLWYDAVSGHMVEKELSTLMF